MTEPNAVPTPPRGGPAVTPLPASPAVPGPGSELTRLLGIRQVSAARGRAVLSWEDAAGTHGTDVDSGVLAVLADAALTGAARTTLGARDISRTAQTDLRFLRPVVHPAGALTAEAHVVHRERQLLTCAVTVSDQRGRLVAVGGRTCTVGPR